MAEAIIRMQDVNKWYGPVPRAAQYQPGRRAGRTHCDLRPVGVGQVDLLIRCINRLEEHQQGHIVVSGTELTNDLKHIEIIRREVGMVFQHFNLFPHLTVLENLTLGPMWVLKTPRCRGRSGRAEVPGAACASQNRPPNFRASCRAGSSSGWRSRGRCA